MKNNKMQCAGCKRRFFFRLRHFVYARSRRSAYMRVGRTAVCPGCYHAVQSAGEQGWRLWGNPCKWYASTAFAGAAPIETRVRTVRCVACAQPTNTRDRRWAYTPVGRSSVCPACDHAVQSAGERGIRCVKGYATYTVYASLEFAEATVIRQGPRRI